MSRRRSPIAIFLAVLFAAGIIAILIFTYISKNSRFTSMSVVSSSENFAAQGCVRGENGCAVFSRDGATGYGSNSAAEWKVSYDMKAPIAAASGDYYIFADKGGSTVCITDSTGGNYPLSVSERISAVDVSSHGVAALLCDAGDKDHIYLYNIAGELLLDIETNVKKDGFAVAIALSPDGKKLVTSYMTVGSGQECRVTFYNFSDVGQNYVDKIVGSYSYGSSLAANIGFISEDSVRVTCSDSVHIYKFKEIPEETCVLKAQGQLLAVADNGTNIVTVQKMTNGTNLIGTYDAKGSLKASFSSSVSFDRMYAEGDEIILTSASSCIIYRTNGKEKFVAKMSDTVRMIYPIIGLNEYIVVDDGQVSRVKLNTERETDEF